MRRSGHIPKATHFSVNCKKGKRRPEQIYLIAVLFTIILCTCAEAASLRKGPYIISPPLNTGIKVIWQTDSTPIHSKIEWGQTLSYSSNSGPLTETGFGENEHLFAYAINNCEPNTHYFYRVTVDSEQVMGSFMTEPQNSDKSVTIYGYGDTRSDPSRHDMVLDALLKDISENPFNRQTILLHSGDWTGAGDSEAAWDQQYFSRSYPNTLDAMSFLSIMGCRGNHEESGGLLRKYWPYNYENDLGFYYSFDYGPAHVTVVDQYVSFLPASDQYSWIENDLANTEKPWKFVLLHEPAWSAGPHENHNSTQQYLCPLFEKYRVAVVQGGHNHNYARCQVNGIQYITTGGGGASLYTPDAEEAHVVMSDKSHHFIRYEIVDEKMIVAAIRDDDSLIERFEISKKRVVCPDCGGAEMVGSVERSSLDEISGIVASRKSPGIFWVHNDYPSAHPEDANKIYAITIDGSIIATYTISGSPGARDPEDIAIGPGPLNGTESPAAGHYIYWGDIGDNSSQYSEIWIKRIPEPSVDLDQTPASITLGPEDGVEVIRLKYPSGVEAPSHNDSETLMIDPLTGDIYVVTKRMYPNRVYKAPYPQSTVDVATMEYVATLAETPGSGGVTGGDISADGSLIILRNEGITDYVSIWYRETGEEIGDRLRQNPCLYEIHAEPQGEAVGFDPQGESFYTVSEAHSSSEPIWHYPITWESSIEEVTLIEKNSSWKYLDDGSDQGTAWKEISFEDGSWASGPAEIGYGDGDEATVVSYGPDAGNKYVTTYFRRSFEAKNSSLFDEVTLNIIRDDGAVVFLNGTEILRSHMPLGVVNFDTLASDPAVSGSEESTFFSANIDPELLFEGNNLMAVEIHQQALTSSDISFNLKLSGKAILNRPIVSTTSASSITPNSAILNGVVNPNDSDTTVVFECVTINSYGNSLYAIQSPVTGVGPQAVSAHLLDLSPNTTYCFRVKATSEAGTSYGDGMTFITSPSSSSVIYVSKDDETCGGNSPCFTSIQDGMNAASADAVIMIAQGTYNESPFLNESKALILKGGWDSLFSTQTSNPTILKAPRATKGSLTLQNVVVRP